MTNLEIEKLTRNTLKSLNFKKSQCYIFQKDCLHMYYRWHDFVREEEHNISYKSFIRDVYDVFKIIIANKQQFNN
jgi:hypothetical protein